MGTQGRVGSPADGAGPRAFRFLWLDSIAGPPALRWKCYGGYEWDAGGRRTVRAARPTSSNARAPGPLPEAALPRRSDMAHLLPRSATDGTGWAYAGLMWLPAAERLR